MSTFRIDDEIVKAKIQTLKRLLQNCEEAYNKSIPTSVYDKGQTHNEVQDLCLSIRQKSYCMGLLMSNTIEFLGQTSEMFKTSDVNWAIEISGPFGGGAGGGGFRGANSAEESSGPFGGGAGGGGFR